MIIKHNLGAMNANRMLNVNWSSNQKTVEKLSSGYRINRSADDAAGLSISEKMRRQVRGLTQASKNAQDGISLCQVADGALNESHDVLQRMNELAVKAANGTNNLEDREAIQAEINQLVTELDRIANSTTFNEGLQPLNGGGQLPPFVGSVSVSIKNDRAGAIEYNGTLYQPGETFVVHDVLAILNGPDYTDYKAVAVGYMTEIYTGKGFYDNDFSGAPISIAGDATPCSIYYAKLSDLKEDDEGYLYVKDFFGFSNEFHLTENNFFFRPSESDKIKKLDMDVVLQVGSEVGQTITFSLVDATASKLGINGVSVLTEDAAGATITKVKDAIDMVSQYRSMYGSIQNRLEHTINNLDNVTENTQSSESRIRDTDMAKEMVQYTNNNILAQAGQMMLAQMNQSHQHVLALLQ